MGMVFSRRERSATRHELRRFFHEVSRFAIGVAKKKKTEDGIAFTSRSMLPTLDFDDVWFTYNIVIHTHTCRHTCRHRISSPFHTICRLIPPPKNSCLVSVPRRLSPLPPPLLPQLLNQTQYHRYIIDTCDGDGNGDGDGDGGEVIGDGAGIGTGDSDSDLGYREDSVVLDVGHGFQ